MFSFVITSYNYEKYIEETILSILGQEYDDWEMIIVDDGSTDDSVSIIKKYCTADSRIKLLQHPMGVNKGIAASMQLGIAESRGQWVSFVESDDSISPDYLKKKIEVIKQYPNIKFIFNAVRVIADERDMESFNKNLGMDYFQEQRKILNSVKFPAKMARQFLKFNFIPTFSCVMLDKSILSGINFDSVVPQWLDTHLWSQLVNKYDFFYVDEELTNWRIHPVSYNKTKINYHLKQEFFRTLQKQVRGVFMSKLVNLKAQMKKHLRGMFRISYSKKEIVLFGRTYSFKQKSKIKKFLQPHEQLCKISIILPVYKAEATIVRCLSSLVAQTYKNLEIVIVYLDSGDNTLSLINNFADERIKIVHQTIKTGPGGGRNLGIDAATGEYIGFIEADDYITSDFYEQLYLAIIDNACDVSFSEIIEIQANDHMLPLTTIEKETIYTTTKEKFSIMTNGAVFNKIFRSSIIKDNCIRFTEGYRFEDNPWLLKVLYVSNRVCSVEGVTYYYCSEGKVWSDDYISLLKDSIPHIAQEMLEYAEDMEFTSNEKNIVREIVINSFVRNFLQDDKVYIALVDIFGKDFFIRRKKMLNQQYGLVIE